VANAEIQNKIQSWDGKPLAESRPLLYREWRSTAVIVVDGVRRSKKPTGPGRPIDAERQRATECDIGPGAQTRTGIGTRSRASGHRRAAILPV
jgi:hypothetical protein